MVNTTTCHAVWLYDELVGRLFHRRNLTWFEFTSDYLENPRRPVLGLRFEENLQGRVASNLQLPPWFSNLLPEGILRDWIALDARVSVDREMELLTTVGHDLPGAVRVLPDGFSPVDDLDLDADLVMGMSASTTPQQSWRMSLAGVGLKFSMLRDNTRFTCPASGLGGDWIVKFPDAAYPHVPINEYTMMRFAAAVGIDVPEVMLVHRDEIIGLPDRVWPNREEFAFGIRRFDRGLPGSLTHIEDLAQVRNVYSRQKYDGNYESIASLVYRGHDEAGLAEFARRLAFFVLIGNGDAHLKNWSLIYSNLRIPTLSPVYDIVATEFYRPGGAPENLALKFCGSRRFSAVRVHQFERLARKLSASTDLAAVAAQLVGDVKSVWPKFADELGPATALRDFISEILSERTMSLLGNV